MLHRKFITRLLALLAVAIYTTASYADHAWGKYKWKPSSVPFILELGDNVNSDWDGHLLIASADWSVSTVLSTDVKLGSTSADPESCSYEVGNVQVCNAAYGENDWLGIAQIYITRGTTIFAGVAKLNDTYYNTAFYDTPAWRQLVMCQEVAHTFGLAHQDEVFDNVNLGTCMDYTGNPEAGFYEDGTVRLSNEYPNQHDYDQLISIYSESKGGKEEGGGCNPKSPKCNPASAAGGHALWGQLVSGQGGKEVYVKDLGNGNKVITHVTRTLEYVQNHSH